MWGVQNKVVDCAMCATNHDRGHYYTHRVHWVHAINIVRVLVGRWHSYRVTEVVNMAGGWSCRWSRSMYLAKVVSSEQDSVLVKHTTYGWRSIAVDPWYISIHITLEGFDSEGTRRRQWARRSTLCRGWRSSSTRSRTSILLSSAWTRRSIQKMQDTER